MARRESAPKNLSEKARLAKNAHIKETYKATRARRAKMECFTRKIKIDRSHLTNRQEEAIKQEAKNEPSGCKYANDFGEKADYTQGTLL